MGFKYTPNNEPYPGPCIYTPIHGRDRSSLSSDSDGEVDPKDLHRRGTSPTKVPLSKWYQEWAFEENSSTVRGKNTSTESKFQSPSRSRRHNTPVHNDSIANSQNQLLKDSRDNLYQQIDLNRKPVRSILKRPGNNFLGEDTVAGAGGYKGANNYIISNGPCKENSNPGPKDDGAYKVCPSYQKTLSAVDMGSFHTVIKDDVPLDQLMVKPEKFSPAVNDALNRGSGNNLTQALKENVDSRSTIIPSSIDAVEVRVNSTANNDIRLENSSHVNSGVSGVDNFVRRRGILKKAGLCGGSMNCSGSSSSSSSSSNNDSRKRLSIGSTSSNSSGDILDFSYESYDGEQSPHNQLLLLHKLNNQQNKSQDVGPREGVLNDEINNYCPVVQDCGQETVRNFSLEYDLMDSPQVCRRAMEIYQHLWWTWFLSTTHFWCGEILGPFFFFFFFFFLNICPIFSACDPMKKKPVSLPSISLTVQSS